MIYDCAIIGGGPAGLNAALVLGRARRTVALFDDHRPRNAVTHASHGFITRDGIHPSEFRRIAYEEVLGYPTVYHWQAEAIDIRRTGHGFVVRMASGEAVEARRIILAAGLKETFPQIEGLSDYYGKSLFACPFCDGWELRDRPLVVISEFPALMHKVKLLLNWSADLVVCTNGSSVLSIEQRQQLADRHIRVVDSRVVSLTGSNGMLERVHFADGTSLARSGGFIDPTLTSKAVFHQPLGYHLTEHGGIVIDEMGRSTAEGVYAAGDSAYLMPSQLIYAAASGSKAAMAVFADYIEESWQLSGH
ncbi:NAD(P)/FAD-dependent oxidoreductase [Paenibacillus sp. YYML68]|uniref:NAD(P)/FAD-dependent oxidoreductase n=1 Tax=Paenibacillus sp. YYML68 TaxID=2909250 RepID=UPI002491E3C3|nr:NAD(P)/FAD-dependent oxidoreductase [Paenibacillus sp. YYML68]